MHKLHTDSLLFTCLSLSFSSVYIYVLDSSYIQYFGNSYLEFGGIDLSALNNITVRFETQVAQGTIFYVDQGPANSEFFFMKLFVLDGILRVKLQKWSYYSWLFVKVVVTTWIKYSVYSWNATVAWILNSFSTISVRLLLQWGGADHTDQLINACWRRRSSHC